MLDLTVFNLPRRLVALSGYRPQVSLNAQFEGTTTYLTLSVEFYKDPHWHGLAMCLVLKTKKIYWAFTSVSNSIFIFWELTKGK